MVNLIINGREIQAEDNETLLQIARDNGIDIPTLCHFANLNDSGSCRICVVEIEGEERLAAACNTIAYDGMNVVTDSDRVKAARKTALQLLLSQHDLNCAYCKRNGTCRFQRLLLDENLIEWDQSGSFMIELPSPYGKQLAKGRRIEWAENSIIQRDENKCIRCGRCIAACNHLEGIGVWSARGTGSRATVAIGNGNNMREAGCVACGQCITHCPTGALTEKDNVQDFLNAIADPNKITVVQVAPATRTSWGTELGFDEGELSIEKMVAALKKLGVDYVFDTSFAADLTIMEEGTELLGILKKDQNNECQKKWPMFTSCCPAWVQHAKNSHKDLLPFLSTAKSPMMMLGATIKNWFSGQIRVKPENICSIAIMPCTAKKAEILMPMDTHSNTSDVDISITTRELIRAIKTVDIDVGALEEVPLDDPLGTFTGAGIIFGSTGGVMEAALRTAYYLTVGDNPDINSFDFFESKFGNWKEGAFPIGDQVVKCAVVHGLNNTDSLINAIRNGKTEYDFVEVMACPTGCAGGGGQPIDGSDSELGMLRGQQLRNIDKEVVPIRYSHENPQIQKLYSSFFGYPCSPLSHHLLHIEHIEREPFSYEKEVAYE